MEFVTVVFSALAVAVAGVWLYHAVPVFLYVYDRYRCIAKGRWDGLIFALEDSPLILILSAETAISALAPPFEHWWDKIEEKFFPHSPPLETDF